MAPKGECRCALWYHDKKQIAIVVEGKTKKSDVAMGWTWKKLWQVLNFSWPSERWKRGTTRARFWTKKKWWNLHCLHNINRNINKNRRQHSKNVKKKRRKADQRWERYKFHFSSCLTCKILLSYFNGDIFIQYEMIFFVFVGFCRIILHW